MPATPNWPPVNYPLRADYTDATPQQLFHPQAHNFADTTINDTVTQLLLDETTLTTATTDVTGLKASRITDETNIGLLQIDVTSLKSSRTTDETNITSLQAAAPRSGSIGARPSAGTVPLNSTYFAEDDRGGCLWINLAGIWTQAGPARNEFGGSQLFYSELGADVNDFLQVNPQTIFTTTLTARGKPFYIECRGVLESFFFSALEIGIPQLYETAPGGSPTIIGVMETLESLPYQWRGQWSGSVSYVVGDAVYRLTSGGGGNETFHAVAPSLNVDPNSFNAVWTLVPDKFSYMTFSRAVGPYPSGNYTYTLQLPASTGNAIQLAKAAANPPGAFGLNPFSMRVTEG